MSDLLDERLDQIRERVRIGTVREAKADRDFLLAEADRTRAFLVAGVAEARSPADPMYQRPARHLVDEWGRFLRSQMTNAGDPPGPTIRVPFLRC